MTAAYRILLRLLATRGRLAAIAAAGVLLIALAIVGEVTGQSRTFAIGLVTAGGFGLLVPISALLFGTAALGDLAEDGTLPYLWLRPQPRWVLEVAALGAAATIAVPFGVVPLVITGAVTGSTRLPVAALGAGALGTFAYAAIFTALGLRSRRALLYGLVYVVVWENIAGRLTSSLARTAIRTHAESLLGAWSEAGAPRFGVSTATALLVLFGITVVAGLAGVRLLRSVELD